MVRSTYSYTVKRLSKNCHSEKITIKKVGVNLPPPSTSSTNVGVRVALKNRIKSLKRKPSHICQMNNNVLFLIYSSQIDVYEQLL